MGSRSQFPLMGKRRTLFNNTQPSREGQNNTGKKGWRKHQTRFVQKQKRKTGVRGQTSGVAAGQEKEVTCVAATTGLEKRKKKVEPTVADLARKHGSHRTATFQIRT